MKSHVLVPPIADPTPDAISARSALPARESILRKGPTRPIGLGLVIGLLAIAGAYAQAQPVQRIDVVDYGIYTLDLTGRQAEPGAVTGGRNLVGNIRRAQTTTTVPAQVGVNFGFNYTIVGAPLDAQVTLRHVTHLPPPGIRHPNSGKVVTQSVYDLTHKIGETTFSGYGFDHPWELVPGTWTFEIWDGSRKLLSRSFTVVK